MKSINTYNYNDAHFGNYTFKINFDSNYPNNIH